MPAIVYRTVGCSSASWKVYRPSIVIWYGIGVGAHRRLAALFQRGGHGDRLERAARREDVRRADVGRAGIRDRVVRVIGRPLRHAPGSRRSSGPSRRSSSCGAWVCATRCLQTCSASYWMSAWMVSRRLLAGTTGVRLTSVSGIGSWSVPTSTSSLPARPASSGVVLVLQALRAGQARRPRSVTGEADDVGGEIGVGSTRSCSSGVMSMPGSWSCADLVCRRHRDAAGEHLVLGDWTDGQHGHDRAGGQPSGPASLAATPAATPPGSAPGSANTV